MPRFFFNIASAGSYVSDHEGLTFRSLDDAYLEACRAALEISFEMLREQQDPNDHRFEIMDEFGAIVLDVPFSEVLRPRKRTDTTPSSQVRDTVHAGLARNRELRYDLAYQIGAARRSVLKTRELLSRSNSDRARQDVWAAPEFNDR